MQAAREQKQFVLFGLRVSDATKAAIRAQFGYEEIPAIGVFQSGAVHGELFHLPKEERDKKTPDELAARYQEIKAKLHGARVIVVQSTGEMPNVSESIEQLRSVTDTLTRNGVKDITLVMPNTAYERQDRDFSEEWRFCSVNAEWFPKDMKAHGVTDVVTFTPHSKAAMKYWEEAFGRSHYHALDTASLFADDIRRNFGLNSNVVIGAPDGADKPNDNGQRRARELADEFFGRHERGTNDAHMFKISKAHTDASETEVKTFEGDVAGKHCIIIDDMADGGSTLVNAAKELKERGAASVSAYVTHAICSDTSKGPSLDVVLQRDTQGEPLIDRFVTTDTIPEIEAKRAALAPQDQQRVNILTIGPLLAQNLNRILGQAHGFAARLTPPEPTAVGYAD